MIVDMSTPGFKFSMDVQRVSRVYIQAKSASGDTAGGVLEVKRAFSDRGDTPRASFSTTRRVDLTGTTIMEICVGKTAFLHFEVTTAISGTSIEIGSMKSGKMNGYASMVEVDTDETGVREQIAINATQESFFLADPVSANTTAVIEMKQSVDDSFERVSFAPAAVLPINGQSITEVDSTPTGVIYATCTTAQAGQVIRLWFYIRNEVAQVGVKDFFLEVAKGNIAGHSVVNKFGSVPDVDSATTFVAVWEGAQGDYLGFNATAAEIATVASSDANDTSAGTGARTVRVMGLDENFEEQEEDVILNGTSLVDTVKSYIRLHRAKVLTAGTGGSNAGVISIAQKVTTANVFAEMPIGNNMTMIAAFTIPAGKDAYVYDWFVGINKKTASAMNARLLMRPPGGVFQVKEELAINSAGTGYVSREYTLPKNTIAGKTDIVIVVNSDSVNASASAGFDLILIDT